MKLNVRNKILAGYSLLLVLVLILSVIFASSLRDLLGNFNFLVEHDTSVLSRTEELIKSVVDMETGMRGFLVTGDEVFLEPLNLAMFGTSNVDPGRTLELTEEGNFQQNFDALFELVSDNPAQQEQLLRVEAATQAWIDDVASVAIPLRREVRDTSLNNDEDQVVFQDVINFIGSGIGKARVDAIRAEVDIFRNEERRLNSLRVAEAQQQASLTQGIVVLGTALAIVLGLVASYYIGYLITNNIRLLVDATRRISEGDFAHRAPQNSSDEIGVLAQTFNQMSDQLKESFDTLEQRIAERTSDLATTVEVGTVATRYVDQDEMLPTVTEFINTRFELYYTQIYILDETQRYAMLRAGTGDAGQQLLAQKHRLDMDGTSLVATAVQTRQTVLVGDTEASEIHLPNPLLPDTRSEIAIPLIVGDEVIGVLDMQADIADTFNEDNVNVFEAMASQLAAALYSTRVYAEIQTAIERAEKLNQRITSENWRGYLGSLNNGKVQYEFDAYGTDTLRLLDDNTSWLDVAQAMQDKHSLNQAVRLGGQMIGRIVVSEDSERKWTLEEQALIADAADRLAQAAEQFRAFDAVEASRREVQKRAIEMETVVRVSATATSTLDMTDLLQAVSDLTKEQFGLYHTHIYLLNDRTQQLTLSGGAGEVGRQMVARGHQIALNAPASLVARAARTKQGVVVDDVTLAEDFLPNPSLPNTRSEMSVPMIVNNKVVGVMDAQSEDVARFDDNDVQIFTALASQVAVSVENARAFEREHETVERLREVDQLKSQFLANMSHELRTPLNSIIGYAGILAEGAEGELPEEAVEDISIIHESGKHLLAIINDILDLAKIEAREMKLRFSEVDLPKILEEVVRSGQVLADEKNIKLDFVKEDAVPQVKADMVRLRQVVWNLMSNAMKFTEKGGVTIRCGMLNDDEIYVRIEDTGIGIPADHLNQVFERFRQVDESSTRSAGGTGLGLTITRELIHMHGGEVYAESEVGVGSTFWFNLPVVMPEMDTEEAELKAVGD